MRRTIFVCFVCVFIFFCFFQYYQYRWRHLWVFENERMPYPVMHHVDDTLRIAMIGDSWAGRHSYDMMDSLFQSKLSYQTGLPVKMISKGKGGAKSREIYQLLFEEDAENGTKSLIASGIDYCIISSFWGIMIK